MSSSKYWDAKIKKKLIDNERIKSKFDSSDPFVWRIRDFLLNSNNEIIHTMQRFAGDNNKKKDSLWHKAKKAIGVA